MTMNTDQILELAVTAKVAIPYGVHFTIPPEDYHGIPGASASKLKAFHRTTPAHARVKLEEPFEQTPFTLMGTLVHDITLEGGKIQDRIVIQPETYGPERKKWTYNATECKEWRQKRAEEGQIIVTSLQFARVMSMAARLACHSEIGPVIADAKTEVSVITHDFTNDVPFRCRMDIVPNGLPYLADIKCVSDITDRGLTNNAYDSGWHIQAAAYLAVWDSQCGAEDRRTGFRFICVENEAPFSVRWFECSERFLEQGRTDMARYLKLYAECTRTGIWPGYPSEVQTLDLPGYVRDGE